MKAKSIKGNSPSDIKQAFTQSLADGFTPTLAFVFISIKQDRADIVSMLDEKGVTIFGATTCGEFIDGDISSGGIAILLLDMDKAHFHLILESYSGKDVATVTKAMTEAALARFQHPAFLLSNGLTVPEGLTLGEPIIRTMDEVAGAGAVIWGGVAGDDTRFKETMVFSNHASMQIIEEN